MSLLKIVKLPPRDGGDSMARVEDMLIRRFDASDENIKELRCDLAGIGQKVDTHAISIKQIELQMAQLSVTDSRMNPSCQVHLSVIFKLGYTRQNQRRIVTYETDHRRGIVTSLMRQTRPG